MKNVRAARIWGFIIDYFIWYILMVIMIIINFLVINNETAFAGNLAGYQVYFDKIMHAPSFIISYILVLIVYEIVIPIFMNGQTISKKILKIQVSEASVSKLCIRGLIKILVINPCGIISFVFGMFLGLELVNVIANILSAVLLVNILSLFAGKDTIHTRFSRTKVKCI